MISMRDRMEAWREGFWVVAILMIFCFVWGVRQTVRIHNIKPVIAAHEATAKWYNQVMSAQAIEINDLKYQVRNCEEICVD